GGLDVIHLDDALGDDAGLADERARELVVAGRAVEQDEAIVGELLQTDAVAPSERVMAAHHEDELVVEEGDELGFRMLDRSADPEIDLAPEDHLEHLFGVSGADAHADLRVRRLE